MVDFYTVKVVLDYVELKIRHHSSIQVKSGYVLRMRNWDFSKQIPHVGLNISLPAIVPFS